MIKGSRQQKQMLRILLCWKRELIFLPPCTGSLGRLVAPVDEMVNDVAVLVAAFSAIYNSLFTPATKPYFHVKKKLQEEYGG